MSLRSIWRPLTIPVASLAVLLAVFAIGAAVTMLSSPATLAGTVSGPEAVFLYFVVWVGVLVAALGTVITPAGGCGVTSDRY